MQIPKNTLRPHSAIIELTVTTDALFIVSQNTMHLEVHPPRVFVMHTKQ